MPLRDGVAALLSNCLFEKGFGEVLRTADQIIALVSTDNPPAKPPGVTAERVRVVVQGHGSMWVHIPDDMMKTLGWKAGDAVDIVPQGDGSVLVKKTRTPSALDGQLFYVPYCVGSGDGSSATHHPIWMKDFGKTLSPHPDVFTSRFLIDGNVHWVKTDVNKYKPEFQAEVRLENEAEFLATLGLDWRKAVAQET